MPNRPSAGGGGGMNPLLLKLLMGDGNKDMSGVNFQPSIQPGVLNADGTSQGVSYTQKAVPTHWWNNGKAENINNLLTVGRIKEADTGAQDLLNAKNKLPIEAERTQQTADINRKAYIQQLTESLPIEGKQKVLDALAAIDPEVKRTIAVGKATTDNALDAQNRLRPGINQGLEDAARIARIAAEEQSKNIGKSTGEQQILNATNMLPINKKALQNTLGPNLLYNNKIIPTDDAEETYKSRINPIVMGTVGDESLLDASKVKEAQNQQRRDAQINALTEGDKLKIAGLTSGTDLLNAGLAAKNAPSTFATAQKALELKNVLTQSQADAYKTMAASPGSSIFNRNTGAEVFRNPGQQERTMQMITGGASPTGNVNTGSVTGAPTTPSTPSPNIPTASNPYPDNVPYIGPNGQPMINRNGGVPYALRPEQ